MSFPDILMEEYNTGMISSSTALDLLDIYCEKKEDIEERYKSLRNKLDVLTQETKELSPREKALVKYVNAHYDEIVDLFQEVEKSSSPEKYDDVMIKSNRLQIFTLLALVISAIMIDISKLSNIGAIGGLVSFILLGISRYIRKLRYRKTAKHTEKVIKQLYRLREIFSKVNVPEDKDKIPDKWYEAYESVETIQDEIEYTIGTFEHADTAAQVYSRW